MENLDNWIGKECRLQLKCCHYGVKHNDSCVEMNKVILSNINEFGIMVSFSDDDDEDVDIFFVPWHRVLVIDRLGCVK